MFSRPSQTPKVTYEARGEVAIATYPRSKFVEHDRDGAEDQGRKTQQCARPVYAHLRIPVSGRLGGMIF